MFVARKKSRCKLTGNRHVIPHAQSRQPLWAFTNALNKK